MDNTIDMGGYNAEICGLYRFRFDCGRRELLTKVGSHISGYDPRDYDI